MTEQNQKPTPKRGWVKPTLYVGGGGILFFLLLDFIGPFIGFILLFGSGFGSGYVTHWVTGGKSKKEKELKDKASTGMQTLGKEVLKKALFSDTPQLEQPRNKEVNFQQEKQPEVVEADIQAEIDEELRQMQQGS